MMLMIVISIVIIGLISYLLLAPIVIDIDSKQDLYMARFHRLFSMRLVPGDWPWQIEMRIVGFKKIMKLKPEVKKEKAIKKEGQAKTVVKKSAKAFKVTVRQMLAVLRSFKVKHCRLCINLGDAALNGKYFPVFWLTGCLLSTPVQTIFTGSSIIKIEIRNTIGRMLLAFIKNRRS